MAKIIIWIWIIVPLCARFTTIFYHMFSCACTAVVIWHGLSQNAGDLLLSSNYTAGVSSYTKWKEHPFCKYIKYLGVIFDRTITWRLHIKTIKAKAFRAFITSYSLFKSERLSTSIKSTFHKALIRSIMTYVVPPGNLWQISIYCNWSACKTRFFAPQTLFQGAHQSKNCIRLNILYINVYTGCGKLAFLFLPTAQFKKGS
jgi:hypothetical protein